MDWQIAEDEPVNPPPGEPEEIPPPTEEEMDREFAREMAELEVMGFNPDITIDEVM